MVKGLLPCSESSLQSCENINQGKESLGGVQAGGQEWLLSIAGTELLLQFRCSHTLGQLSQHHTAPGPKTSCQFSKHYLRLGAGEGFTIH